MLCIARKRIPTPVCALARNDTVFERFRTKTAAYCFEKLVIARVEDPWQSVPLIRHSEFGIHRNDKSDLKKFPKDVYPSGMCVLFGFFDQILLPGEVDLFFFPIIGLPDAKTKLL